MTPNPHHTFNCGRELSYQRRVRYYTPRRIQQRVGVSYCTRVQNTKNQRPDIPIQIIRLLRIPGLRQHRRTILTHGTYFSRTPTNINYWIGNIINCTGGDKLAYSTRFILLLFFKLLRLTYFKNHNNQHYYLYLGCKFKMYMKTGTIGTNIVEKSLQKPC